MRKIEQELTLFSIPKPFRGHFSVIQRNAIRSWNLLQPQCEIILFGDDHGTKEVAEEFGLRNVSEIACNEYGTPLVNKLFEAAQNMAAHDLVCYVNADIILLSDFTQAVERVTRLKKRFLLVGQRWDVDLKEPWNFQEPDWEDKLRDYTRENGRLHELTGIDYFVFNRGLYAGIPPFAIGRTIWDNWLLYRARQKGYPVIDASQMVMAIHQNHEYSQQPEGKDWIIEGPEAKGNLKLAGGWGHVFTLADSTHFLSPAGLKKALDWARLRRRFNTLPTLHPYLGLPLRILSKALELLCALSARIGIARPSTDSGTEEP